MTKKEYLNKVKSMSCFEDLYKTLKQSVLNAEPQDFEYYLEILGLYENTLVSEKRKLLRSVSLLESAADESISQEIKKSWQAVESTQSSEDKNFENALINQLNNK